MSNQVGDLYVKIGADTIPLDDAEKRVKKSVDNIDRSLVGLGRNVSTGLMTPIKVAAAVVAGAALVIKNVVDRIDNLSEAAVQAGISLEKMSALTFSSAIVGVQGFDKALLTLYKNMSVNNPMSEQQLLFSQLGISVRNADGSLRSVDSVLDQLADKFAKMKDGPEKSAIAMKAFGDTGANMVQFLNRGSVGLARMRAEAEAVGGVLNNQTGVVVKEISGDFARMGGAVTGISNEFMRGFGPVIQNVTNWLSNLLVNVARWVKEGDIMNKVARGATIAWEVLSYSVRQVVANLSTAFQLLKAGASLNFGEMTEIMKRHGIESEAALKASQDRIAANQKYMLDSNWNATVEYAKKAPAPIIKSAAEIEKALQEIKTANQYNLADLVGDQTMEAGLKLQFLEEMVKKGQATWREYLEAVKTVRAEMYANLNQDLLNVDTVATEEKLAALKNAFDQNIILMREYKAVSESISKAGQQHMQDLASTTAQALTTIFRENKTAAIAAAIINTAQGVTKALANYPPPISFAMAGLQTAMGVAQISQIKNTNKGSSTYSGGGAVAGAAASAATAPVKDQTLYVQGISKNGIFDGETVRYLAGRLIDFQKDGGKVILA